MLRHLKANPESDRGVAKLRKKLKEDVIVNFRLLRHILKVTRKENRQPIVEQLNSSSAHLIEKINKIKKLASVIEFRKECADTLDSSKALVERARDGDTPLPKEGRKVVIELMPDINSTTMRFTPSTGICEIFASDRASSLKLAVLEMIGQEVIRDFPEDIKNPKTGALHFSQKRGKYRVELKDHYHLVAFSFGYVKEKNDAITP